MTTGVRDWYTNKAIFITGATGFMGKVLIEILLRSCPDLNSIYILMRPKNGIEPQQRTTSFIKLPIFEELQNRPDSKNIFAKLRVVCGDIAQANLGLKPEDAEELRSSVAVVFHMAANVRFDQTLKESAKLNIGGTIKVLDFCCTMRKLQAFIYVSTAYCHCDETVVEERMYPAPHQPRKLLEMTTWMNDDLLSSLTPKLLERSPNTYCYTKCLTEQLVAEYADRVPILVARPSIVSASWREPIPGWVDSLNGPTGVLIGAGKGVIRTMHCCSYLAVDSVPVDVAINSLILLAWKLGNSPRTEKPMVYHITANKDNPISWGDAIAMGKKHVYNNPFSVCLWYPGGNVNSSYTVHIITAFFLHLIPAYMIDFFLTLTCNKPFLVGIQKRIQIGLEVLRYFTTRNWFFHNEKLKKLCESLNDEEKKEFYTDTKNIDWDDYMLKYVLGCRKYCCHEQPETIPHARKILKRLYYLDVAKNIVLCIFLLWIFLSMFVKYVLP